MGIDLGLGLLRGQSAQKQAEANAEIDRADAAQALDEARRRALARRQEGSEAAKTIQAQTAASGFTQEGTSLENQIDAIKTSELNALEETRVGQVKAKRLEQSAALNIKRGKIAKRTAIIEGLASSVKKVGGALGG